ncbi:/ / hypothetical protein / 382769:382951 Reverse [Candidatus Hepatoplasma crinochetorum]|uniref:Uncharacterized protein n=1 Tax=Candidatus Hepatoplasma crinochetorum TaxID=295596 RepID=A0A0G7ZN27_9MOLU|nr:/ / hypothetical protein / 382769:382951 Reverse [Candidatus Hepatoplasma crinochetorum]
MSYFKNIFYSKKRKREILELLALEETKEVDFDWKKEIKLSDIDKQLENEILSLNINDSEK